MRLVKLLIFLTTLFVAYPVCAATVTHGVTLTDNSDLITYTTGSFTPAANDLLVVGVIVRATADPGSVSDSLGGSWTEVTSGTFGINKVWCFVRNSLAPASSMTVSMNVTGDTGLAAIVFVARIAGMTQTGAAAIRQSAIKTSESSSTTPFGTFANAALTGNPTLGFLFNLSTSVGFTPPTSWTEQADVGTTGPTGSGEYVSRDSGFTGTTVTWGSDSNSTWSSIILELDVSSGTNPPTGMETVSGAGWIQAGGVAAPAAGFSIIKWSTPFGVGQQGAATISTLPSDGDDFYFYFYMTDLNNRYRVKLTRVVNGNDTITLDKIVAGATVPVSGPISLGLNASVNDRIGIDAGANVVDVNYFAQAWAEWRIIMENVSTPSPPTSSHIGFGADTPTEVTLLAGQGDAGDTTAPSAPAGCTATTPAPTQSEISLTCNATEADTVLYRDERCNAVGSGCPGGVFTEIRATSALTFVDGNRLPSTTYSYRRRACDLNQCGAYSATFETTTGSALDKSRTRFFFIGK